MTRAALNRPEAVVRYAHALSVLGVTLWTEGVIVDDFPIMAFLTQWFDPSPERLLSQAQTLYDSRADITVPVAAVAVLVRETGPLSRFAGLVRDGETRNVKVVLVARDGSVRGETSGYAPTETDRDGGPR